MLISCNWLARHVELDGVDLEALGLRITLNVAELEGIHRVGEDAANARVGLVLSAEPIEGTHLMACQVDMGGGQPQMIVCGAPNVAQGQRVPVFLPGAKMGDIVIEERQMRGHLSQGIIASERELGFSDDHEGIMVLEGQPSAGTKMGDLFEVEDTLFEIDNKSLTHRPDLWGHRGIARELATLLGRSLKPLDLRCDYTSNTPLDIQVQQPDDCPRYLGVTLEGIRVEPSPLWMRLLLHRVDIRAINNVVDATNFVMLDLGNPLHAFDRRQLMGDRIVVRCANKDEAFTTLDGVSHQLKPSDLLIGDGQRGVALAGIMGGENSEIQDDTTSVVLEAANFNPSTVRLTAVRLGLRTDSSARFEKSLDPHLAEDASRACCRLLQDVIPGARITSALMDVAAPFPPLPEIELRLSQVQQRLGVPMELDEVRKILTGLEFQVETLDDSRLRVTVPSFRAAKDIAIEADLIEELGRSYGYDNIPPQPPAVVLSRPHANKQKSFERSARSYLSQAVGMDEVLTYSFGFDPFLERIDAKPESRLALKNPISAEMPSLRTDLSTNLLAVLERNARAEDDIRIFELGRIFRPVETQGELPHQPVVLAGLLALRQQDGQDQPGLCSVMRGALDGLAQAIGRQGPRFQQGGVPYPWVHPVRQARLLLGDEVVGYVGDIHPMTLHTLDIRHQGTLFEIDLDAWRSEVEADVQYRPLPRYPAVFRDFAVLVDENTRADEVQSAIAQAAPSLVCNVTFQSAYRGSGIPAGQKCLAWSVTFLDREATLTDPQIRELENAVWASLSQRVAGQPRA
jgi:phenylalanyl-tRNA synthetase beta chain